MYNYRMSLYNPFVHYLPTKTSVNNNTACETLCSEMLDRCCNRRHFSLDFHGQKYLHRQNGSTPYLGRC